MKTMSIIGVISITASASGGSLFLMVNYFPFVMGLMTQQVFDLRQVLFNLLLFPVQKTIG